MVALAALNPGFGSAEHGGGSGRPPDRRGGFELRSADRRLTGFVVASVLVHALLALEWGFDSGRRPAQSTSAPTVLTARLAPPAEPAPDLQPEVVLTAPEAPAQIAPALPEPERVERTPPPAVSAPQSELSQPGPQPPDPAPKAGSERPGSTDLTWYTGRDLDVLPRPLTPIEPLFPLNAQLRGVSGKVTLAVSIDTLGRVVDVEVVRAEPPGYFEDAARNAFAAARYSPGIKDGRVVRARLQTVVVFEQGAPK